MLYFRSLTMQNKDNVDQLYSQQYLAVHKHFFSIDINEMLTPVGFSQADQSTVHSRAGTHCGCDVGVLSQQGVGLRIEG